MSGFLNSATNFAIQDFEICPHYYLDLEHSCADATEGNMDVASSGSLFDQGSGSKMLVPEHTSTTDYVQEPSPTPTAQDTSTHPDLSPSATTTLTSTDVATSIESSEVSTAQSPSNSSNNHSVDIDTAILGVVAAFFATIIIIILLVYIVKKYRKRGIYTLPQEFVREEERIVSSN